MSENPTVLLVDDDRALIEGAQMRLQASGYETLNAFDGNDGVDCAFKHPAEAIILDVEMPHATGDEML